MVSITIDNITKQFSITELKEEVRHLMEETNPASLQGHFQYRDRGDEGLQIIIQGKNGLLEVGLDDPTVVHMYCSLSEGLELLGVALRIVDHFRVRYSGECEVDEVRYLEYLHKAVETGKLD